MYKTKSPPWSVAGGDEGRPNEIVLNPGTAREEKKAGSYNLLDAGEVLANNTGGGGGYGNPFDRDPERVWRDVRNGFVSVAAAASDYGVILDEDTLSVDHPATTRRRNGGEAK